MLLDVGSQLDLPNSCPSFPSVYFREQLISLRCAEQYLYQRNAPHLSRAQNRLLLPPTGTDFKESFRDRFLVWQHLTIGVAQRHIWQESP
jgi:hypothetical protein